MTTWLITGCSTGLGRALAEAVLARGDNAVVTARDAAKVQDLAETHPDTALALPLDVTDDAQVTAAVAAAEKRFGGVDVLVNNAGYGYRAAVEEGEDGPVRQLFDTHVFGTVRTIKAVLPGMRCPTLGHDREPLLDRRADLPRRLRLLLGGQGRDRGVDAVAPQGARTPRDHRHGRRAGRLPHRLRRAFAHPVGPADRRLRRHRGQAPQGARHRARDPAGRSRQGRRGPDHGGRVRPSRRTCCCSATTPRTASAPPWTACAARSTPGSRSVAAPASTPEQHAHR